VRIPTSLDALRERNFARYLSAVSVSTLGNTMAIVALAFAVLDFGDPTDLGFVLLVREVPIVVFVLLGGVWADRIPRKLILVGAELVRGSTQAATAALLFTGQASVWNVAALQMVFGVANAFSRPATTGLIQQAVTAERLQEANALLGLSRSSLSIVGPAIGAVIVSAASPAWALAADAGTFAISAALIASMRLAPVVRAAKASVLGELRDGWREFRARSWVVAMVVSFGVFQLTYFPALFVLGPFVADGQLGGAGAWGAILSASAVGSVVGGLITLRVRFSRPLVACALLMVPPGGVVLALAVPAPVVAIAAIGLLANAGLAIGDAVWFTTFQQKIPEHAISRISSFDWLGSVALNPIGYALIGPLAAAVGVTTTLVVAGVLNSIVGLALLAVPAVRSLRSEPARAAVAVSA
jgi:MFS family permease